MGMTSSDLSVICYLKENGYLTNQSVVEIGAQQLTNDFLCNTALLEKTGNLFSANFPMKFSQPTKKELVHGTLEHQDASAPLSREFWQWIGFSHTAIDIDESPGSILLDLNTDQVSKQLRGKFGLVTNMGTTEHVANQLNAFKIIHELTALHGVMYHLLPAQGMMNHGLINYNPKFFWMLSRSNGYKWVYSNYLSCDYYYDLPENIVGQVMPYNPDIAELAKSYKVSDTAIVVAMQKIYDSPFVPPLDVPTHSVTSIKALKERYWSVFNEKPFEIYQKQNELALQKKEETIWQKLGSFLKISQ